MDILGYSIQSSVLSGLKTNNPMIDAIITTFIVSLFAAYHEQISVVLTRGYESIKKLIGIRASVHTVNLEQYDQRRYVNTVYELFCWWVAYELKCAKGQLRFCQMSEYNIDDGGNGNVVKYTYLIPEFDTKHAFEYDDKLITFEFWKKEMGNAKTRDSVCGVKLECNGNNCQPIIDFLKQLPIKKENWLQMTKWKQHVYTHDGGEWKGQLTHNTKTLETVVLDGDLCDRIKADLKRFMRSEAFYQKMGIPFCRGYLLHGPPGTGKTSLLKGMSFDLQMDIYMLSLGDIKSDVNLKKLFDTIPERSMLVIEDIDCMTKAVHAREVVDDADDFQKLSESSTDSAVASAVAAVTKAMCLPEGSGITLSTLLNLLDGVYNQHGRIMVMTTNHVEKLDPALIRPGRCDMIIKLGKCTVSQVEKLYELYFDEPMSDAGREWIVNDVLSPADVSGLFLQHRDDRSKAIKELKKLFASKVV